MKIEYRGMTGNIELVPGAIVYGRHGWVVHFPTWAVGGDLIRYPRRTEKYATWAMAKTEYFEEVRAIDREVRRRYEIKEVA